MKRTPAKYRQSSQSLWATIREQVYRQWRVNQATCQPGSANQVDIFATTNNANKIHKLLKRKVKKRKVNSSYAMPKVVKWNESPMPIIAMTCRAYDTNLFFPGLTVNVLIPDDKRYKDIFAIPDYQSGTYFCFLTMKRRKNPR